MASLGGDLASDNRRDYGADASDGACTAQTRSAGLSIAVGYAPAREVVRRHFDSDTITHENANMVPSQLAGDRRQHHMLAVVQTHFEEGVRLFVDNRAFSGN